MEGTTPRRRLPIGAELARPEDGGGARFRVWAPRRRRVDVVLEDRIAPLTAEGNGYFSGHVDGARAGHTYRYRLDGDRSFPDPASRFQPEGPHGPSQIVDPGAYAWRDAGWMGASIEGQVVYEMHIGTFTREGTYASAMAELPRLADVGVSLLEIMPLADFPGAFGWGYDGVNLFAPTRLYGTPDDLRRFVDEAHRLGLGVILDVVYNHFGPAGNYMGEFSTSYVSTKYANEWGDAINFDGEESDSVRELYVANAGYWIEEFHFDGLRLDATQSIHDCTGDHVIAAIARRAREAAGARPIVLVAENERQTTCLVRDPSRKGYGIDALWNDDFHHSAIVALTGRNEAYYSDHEGTPQELLSATKWGYLFQGQRYAWQKKGRGTSALDLPATAFISYLENHDQVANSGHGARLHQMTSPGRLRAMTALTLLSPATPMLFQGQELASPAPFLFFADHEPELAAKVTEGRAEFMRQFPSLASAEAQARLADPASRATFERCKLDGRVHEGNAWAVALHRDLLRLRRTDRAFAAQDRDRVHGSVLASEAFLLRFMCDEGDRLLVVNLGRDLVLGSIADPLAASPSGGHWRVLWSSEDPRYGGDGTPEVDGADGWRIPGHSAVVLVPEGDATHGTDQARGTP
jgi:maltooligosyltrehalose trehalohydrolase